ncbi:MAG TPA: hypothetical protein VF941_12645, partial [Clostridia bacterium]
MINKSKKSSLKAFGSIIFIIVISFASLSGCGSSKETSANEGSTKNIEKTAGTASTITQDSTLQNTTDRTNKGETAAATSTAVVSKTDSSLAGYISLLGLSRDKLASTLNEKPVFVDEGGLEFKKAGIRIWFDGTSASQIFTQRKDIDLNGAKIGDKIDRFKEKLGQPVSDKNGDMHFKYKDVFLSINYDTGTKDTFALYILKKDLSVDASGDAKDEKTIRTIVERFGKVLKNVSLLAPDTDIIKSMKANYAEYVTPDLLANWEGNPSVRAAGRLTSSPWPDRIEISRVVKNADSSYSV